jgi:hypothetical protein
MTNQLILTDAEFSEMFDIDIETLVASRLEDMADRVEVLLKNGKSRDAHMLSAEGLEMAKHYDDNEMFMFLPDLRGMAK